MNKTSFKVDDIVSIKLRPRYEKPLLGIVTKVHNKTPWVPGRELAYGFPSNATYPLVRVYIPSLVVADLGDDGYYWKTANQISAGELTHSSEKLPAPPKNKFKVGDKVTYGTTIIRISRTGIVSAIPTIKNASLYVRWEGTDYDDQVKDHELMLLSDAKATIKRIKAANKTVCAEIERRLETVEQHLRLADDYAKANGTDLDTFLKGNDKVSKRLGKSLSRCWSVINMITGHD